MNNYGNKVFYTPSNIQRFSLPKASVRLYLTRYMKKVAFKLLLDESIKI